MTLTPGHATAEATAPRPMEGIFVSRRRALWPQGPNVSLSGFGTYRVGMTPQLGAPFAAEALQHALKSGMNLVDTSANYGNGQSELLIGKTLKSLMDSGEVKREQVVLMTKAGYIQGNNLELAHERERQGRPFPQVVKFDQVWHSIHPEFLADQLERSRQRLGVECIDVFLLHNPEYILKSFEKDGVPLADARGVFYERIRQAFAYLEECRAKGWIQSFGLSSNTLGSPLDEYPSVSIKDIWEQAQAVAPSHGSGFRVVQFPMNWIEVLPGLLELDELENTTIGWAQNKGLGVVLNRPFNGMYNNGLIRLTRPPIPDSALHELNDAQKEGLKNWKKLSSDLEAMAKLHIDNPGWDDVPLQEMVLATLAWFPGVTSVLSGCRRIEYVEDVRRALSRPALPRAQDVVGQIYENLEFHR